MNSPPKFTICVLLYGDYPDLAKRVLESIGKRLPREYYRLYVWCNQIGDLTKSYVRSLSFLQDGDKVFESKVNRLKYPAMRMMLHRGERIDTPYFMWFDDDSFIRAEVNGRDWLRTIQLKLQAASMLGAVYHIPIQGRQWSWVQEQPWFRGKSKPEKGFRFCTGGWWTIRTTVLYDHDWPTEELAHRGGDVMLGELCRQNDYALVHYTDGVAINADSAGNQCRAARRGFDSAPIGK